MTETTTVEFKPIELLAREAYQRYGNAVGWRAVGGHAMPRWDALPERIQGAWCEAVRGVLQFEPAVAPGALAPPV